MDCRGCLDHVFGVLNTVGYPVSTLKAANTFMVMEHESLVSIARISKLTDEIFLSVSHSS